MLQMLIYALTKVWYNRTYLRMFRISEITGATHFHSYCERPLAV
ncbi:unnamed protein product [Nezara viridula]|uniref:Uncharacterized protein n=1 Tax=Nezara viridula TaxID=85310 RepID=A0A9P0EDT8_NEZVI|nr:unnamed protein product [Nezara viridula]